jgi:hypothetical protein
VDAAATRTTANAVARGPSNGPDWSAAVTWLDGSAAGVVLGDGRSASAGAWVTAGLELTLVRDWSESAPGVSRLSVVGVAGAADGGRLAPRVGLGPAGLFGGVLAGLLGGLLGRLLGGLLGEAGTGLDAAGLGTAIGGGSPSPKDHAIALPTGVRSVAAPTVE